MDVEQIASQLEEIQPLEPQAQIATLGLIISQIEEMLN